MFQSKFSRKGILTAVTALFTALPLYAYAQTGFVRCQGVIFNGNDPVPDCDACHLIEMGNLILIWLIGFLFVIFAVMIFLAGWGLMTSGGSPDAKSAAKSKLTNAIIGILIVLSAWIIVDTMMRGLVTGDGDLGATYSGFGPWSQIECTDQSAYASNVVAESAGDTVTSAPVDCTAIYAAGPRDCSTQIASCESGGGTATAIGPPTGLQVVCETQIGIEDSGTTRVVCDVGPSGDNVLCTAQEAACTATGGTPQVDTSDPTRYEVACIPDTPTEACQTSEMSSINLFGFNTTVHNSIVSQLTAVNSEWQSRGGNSYYRVYSVGAYNCRRVTGGSGYSVHAYGLAVDINPADNGYVRPRPASGCPTNMPSDFVSMFKSRGLGWGGDWRSLCDAMHFSDASHEGGSQSIR